MTASLPGLELQFTAVHNWRLPWEKLAGAVRLDLCPDCESDLRKLVQAAEAAARPRAAWACARSIVAVDSERVVVNGIEFCSKTLAYNLAASDCAWPYLASCGPELDMLSGQSADRKSVV